MSLEIKNFQFIPPSIILQIDDIITIKVLKNQTTSQIYCQERYFILTITQENQYDYQEEIETPPLYENQTFTHKFQKEGSYIVQCANSIPFKAYITVIQKGQEIPLIKTQLQQKQRQKQTQSQKKKDLYAPENRKLKVLGDQEANMASSLILESIKANFLSDDTNNNELIDFILNNNKTNSNIETVSTFNSSFQQHQINSVKADTYSDSGKTTINSILDRKSSDPIASFSKMQERITLTRQKQQQLSVMERIQQAILDNSFTEIDVKQYEHDFKKLHITGTMVFQFLEQEFLFENLENQLCKQ